MNLKDPTLRASGEPGVSVLKIFSIGIVAANKALDSDVIEVTPIEHLPMIDGFINSDTIKQTVKGVDSNGQNYTSETNTGNTLQATWLRLGNGNRKTSPDVRRGSKVLIYQFGDADKYYWVEYDDDSSIRNLETVIYRFSANPKEDTVGDSDNCYYLEISTHTGVITLHTSTVNNENCGFDIQVNGKDGNIIMTDTNGNQFYLDSPTERLGITNVSGTVTEIIKDVANVTANTVNVTGSTTVNIIGGNINMQGSNLTAQFDNVTIKGNSTITLTSPGLTLN